MRSPLPEKEKVEYVSREDFFMEVITKRGRLISIHIFLHNENPIGHYHPGTDTFFVFSQKLGRSVVNDLTQTLMNILTQYGFSSHFVYEVIKEPDVETSDLLWID